MGWTLVRGGHIFDPEDRGISDLLILGGRIAAVGTNLPVPSGIGEGTALDAAADNCPG
jgi:dihydroorotase-like cyclic amidohydrolase